MSLIEPRVIYRSAGDHRPIFFTFHGNFIHAPDRAYTPSLVFGTHTYAPLSPILPQRLEFQVPPSSLFGTSSSREFCKASSLGKLRIFWPGITARNEANFSVTIYALPSSPGGVQINFTITKRVVTEKRAYEVKASPDFSASVSLHHRLHHPLNHSLHHRLHHASHHPFGHLKVYEEDKTEAGVIKAELAWMTSKTVAKIPRKDMLGIDIGITSAPVF